MRIVSALVIEGVSHGRSFKRVLARVKRSVI